MTERKYYLHDGRSGSAITVRVTPRASKNEIGGVLDDGTVKVRLTAGSPESNINAALIAFLSEILGVPAAQIEIVAGKTGKDKLVTISRMDKVAVHQRILQKLV